jgi:hypothetical protein
VRIGDKRIEARTVLWIHLPLFVPPHLDSSLRSESDLSPMGRGRYRTYDCLGCVLPPTILSQVPVGT